MPERPTSVTVLAVITILLSCAGLACLPVSAWSTLANTASPTYFIIEENPLLRFWVIASTVLGVLASFAALAGGVGAWMMEPWGRMVLLGYAIYSVVMTLVGTVISVLFFVMPMLQAIDMESETGPAMMGGAIGGVCGGLCGGMLLPVALLFFLTRPHVTAAFAQRTV